MPHCNRRQFMERTLGTGLALGAPAALSARPTSQPTTLLSAMNIHPDTATWTPFCFGRLMVQLPPGSKTGLRSTFWTKDLKLREDLTSLQHLQAEVQAKEQAFKNQKHQNFGNRFIQTYGLGGKGVSVWGYHRGEINLFPAVKVSQRGCKLG